MHGFKNMKLGGVTPPDAVRKIAIGVFSLVTGFYCAEPCTAALLHVMGAVRAAQLASSTIFIFGIAAMSLGWVLWRTYRAQRTGTKHNCHATRAAWLTIVLTVAAFVVDVSV